ncbi:MAG: Rv3235 family protein [Buchananella hordeovulneris]|nr:Rv3235 family protein [Buchananella hordeovulneris]
MSAAPLRSTAPVGSQRVIEAKPPVVLAAIGGDKRRPDPALWGAGLARACIEAILCKRDPAQLARWLLPDLHAAVVRRAGLYRRLKGVSLAPVQLLAHHCYTLPSGCYELCATIHDGHRVRAVALRVEPFRSRWLVTALEIG